MYKSQKVREEIGFFIKHHVVICVLFFISLLVIIKNSHIPAPRWLPELIVDLMLCPPENTVSGEWWGLLGNICMAFISSIIAYVFIQYIPERRKAYKAFIILKKEFCSLYSYMSYLVSMYLFEIGVKQSDALISESDLSPICYVELYDQKQYCRIQHTRNKAYENVVDICYNLYSDSKKYADLVNKTIRQIKETICAANLDSDIIETVSLIENNWFLQYFSYLNKPYTKTPGYKPFILNFDKGFIEFVKCHCSLEKYNFDLISYEFSEMSDEEIKKEKERQLFMSTRDIYKYFGVSRAMSIAEDITALEATEERLRKSEGVMLEMIVFYDFTSPKQYTILETALKIAEYIIQNETDEISQKTAFLNAMQIKKRMNVLSDGELEQICDIADDDELPPYIIVGASILIEDYVKAAEYFGKLSNNEQSFFAQLPIYRLWPEPPIEASSDPMLFLYCKDSD